MPQGYIKRWWNRRKRTSLRRLVARYRAGRWISHEDIENTPGLFERLSRIAPPQYHPHTDHWRMTPPTTGG